MNIIKPYIYKTFIYLPFFDSSGLDNNYPGISRIYINIMNMSCLHQPPKYMLHSSEEVENKVEFSIYGTSRDCIISNLLDTFALWYNIVLLSTPLHVFYIYKYKTTYICHTISYICCAYAM